MGPKVSTATSPEYKALIADYEALEEHTEAGTTVLRHKRTGQHALLHEYTFNEQRDYDKQVDWLNARKERLIASRHLCQLERVITYKEEQYCSTSYKIYALMGWSHRNLREEVASRSQKGEKVGENELWDVLNCSVPTLAFLQKQSIKHQAITSQSILKRPEGGWQLYDPQLAGVQSNYDTISNQRSSKQVYLSPELAHALQEEMSSPHCHPYKSDVWSLGMVILEAGLGEAQDGCYKEEGARVNWDQLAFNINRFQHNFSPDLTNFVTLMLSRQERMRPDWGQLEERLTRRGGSFRTSHAQRISSISASRPLMPTDPNTSLLNHSARFDTSFTVPIYTDPSRHSVNARPSHPNTINVLGPSSVSPPPPAASAQPVKPSQLTEINRPKRSVFPPSNYQTETKVDENLIAVPDQYSEVSETPHPQGNFFYESGQKQPLEPQSAGVYNHPFTPASGDKVQGQYRSVSNHHPTHPFEASAGGPIQGEQNGDYVVEKYKQGSEYKGYKWNGMRHGHGVFYYQDGGMYEGQWRLNKMEGHGRLFYQSGKLAYDGQWLNDQFSGSGTLYNEEPEPLTTPFDHTNLDDVDEFWTKYQGNFSQDLKNGRGVLFLSNGEVFEGTFEGDYAEGEGVFSRTNGQIIRGRWSKNKLIS